MGRGATENTGLSRVGPRDREATILAARLDQVGEEFLAFAEPLVPGEYQLYELPALPSIGETQLPDPYLIDGLVSVRLEVGRFDWKPLEFHCWIEWQTDRGRDGDLLKPHSKLSKTLQETSDYLATLDIDRSWSEMAWLLMPELDRRVPKWQEELRAWSAACDTDRPFSFGHHGGLG